MAFVQIGWLVVGEDETPLRTGGWNKTTKLYKSKGGASASRNAYCRNHHKAQDSYRVVTAYVNELDLPPYAASAPR